MNRRAFIAGSAAVIAAPILPDTLAEGDALAALPVTRALNCAPGAFSAGDWLIVREGGVTKARRIVQVTTDEDAIVIEPRMHVRRLNRSTAA